MISPRRCTNSGVLVDLWEHESLRVFHDGLSDPEDQRMLKRMVTRIKQEHFVDIELAANRQKIKHFGDYLSDELAPSSRPYQEVIEWLSAKYLLLGDSHCICIHKVPNDCPCLAI